jgi:hypothetical protein
MAARQKTPSGTIELSGDTKSILGIDRDEQVQNLSPSSDFPETSKRRNRSDGRAYR